MDLSYFCSRCIYPLDHPLLLTKDADGICSGCRVHEEKYRIDWRERWSELRDLVQPYRTEGQSYDCIVPVTGAGDSYFVVHTVKERLGLKPLLVHYNNHFSTPLGIRNLANLRIRFGCDIQLQTLAPSRIKRITSVTLADLGSVYWSSHAGRTVWPVQVAVAKKIPLIIWGAHQGLEQTGQFSHLDTVEMTRRYRHDHDLLGVEPEQLVTAYGLLSESDLRTFFYPSDELLRRVGVRGIYLGNYVPWDPRSQHEEMVSKYDFLAARSPRTFDTYEHSDCYVYMSAHDILKEARLGYGRSTDHAVREIRHGRLSRDAAWLLSRRSLRDRNPVGLKLFLDWLGVSHSGWTHLVRKWSEMRPPTGEGRVSPLNPLPRFRATRFRRGYAVTGDRDIRKDPGMVLFERGYP